MEQAIKAAASGDEEDGYVGLRKSMSYYRNNHLVPSFCFVLLLVVVVVVVVCLFLLLFLHFGI